MEAHTLVLAAILTPALLYGGIGAVAAPILIHLLARRRFRRIRWAAMDFLLEAQRRNRRRLRMEEWILLALRCLAVALIGLLLARPFIKPAGWAAALGGTRRTERIFVIDDSFSMMYETPNGTPFEQAKEGVRRILEALRRETPDDSVTILRTSQPSEPVTSERFLGASQFDALLARLNALTPVMRAMEPAKMVAGVVDVMQRNPETTSAAIYVMSDFRRQDWVAHASDDAGGAGVHGVLAPLAEWGKSARGLQIVLVDIGVDDARNTAVTSLHARDGQLVAGAVGTLHLEAGNFGPTPLNDVEVQVRVGQTPQPAKRLAELPARQTAAMDLEVEFLRPGYEGVQVELPPDSLAVDNVRYLAADVASAIRILVVDGEPSADDFEDEVSFLETALRPAGELFSGNEVTTVDETELEGKDFSSFHLVILANVYRVSEAAAEALERFVRRGGGLLIFAGDQIDPASYNGALGRNGDGLLPARLTEILKPSEPVRLTVADRLHPAMQGLSREGDPLGLGQIPFFAYYGAEPFEAAQGEPSRSAVESPRVIARFGDAQETPAIVERKFGDGRVVLFTTTVDKEWNLWPDHPTYLPVMLEFVRHLARGGDRMEAATVGEPVRFALDANQFETEVTVRPPGYPNEPEVRVGGAVTGDGGLTFEWNGAERSGLYEFLLRKRDGGELARLAAVNLDPRESDLTPSGEQELRKALGGVPFEYVKGLERLGAGAAEARTELWRGALIAAVLVLLSEQTLAFWWGRKR